jgi:AcrR family transcriptional regulator
MPEPNNQTRRQRLEAREESIIAAAREEFLENGLEGAKVAGIARRAGVAEGTLYLYFRNRNALLAAVVGSFYARMTETAEAGILEPATTLDRLAFLARHHLKCCMEEWSILALAIPAFYQVSEYRDSDFFEFNRAYVAVFDQVIREGVNRGDISTALPLHVMRDLFYGTLEHSVRTYMVRGQDLADEEAIERLAEQVMTMVRPALGVERNSDAAESRSDLASLVQRLEKVTKRLDAGKTRNSTPS